MNGRNYLDDAYEDAKFWTLDFGQTRHYVERVQRYQVEQRRTRVRREEENLKKYKRVTDRWWTVLMWLVGIYIAGVILSGLAVWKVTH